MKNLYLSLLIFAPLFISSCGSSEPAVEPAPWGGVYFGDQSDYFLTNNFGEHTVIRGQKILVPGSAYTLTLKGLWIEVKQIVKDKSMGTIFYVGTCLVDVKSETMAQLSCTCKEQSSNKYPTEPEISLYINLVDKTMVVNGNFGPEFIVAVITESEVDELTINSEADYNFSNAAGVDDVLAAEPNYETQVVSVDEAIQQEVKKRVELESHSIPNVNNQDFTTQVVHLYRINDPDGWTNMRNGPNGEILRQVDSLEIFQIIGEEGNWKIVLFENEEKGYIHNSRIVTSK